MSILNLNAVNLHQGGNHLLDHVHWQIEEHERIALVGRNGAGKSSLLRLLQGELVPDSGQVSRISGLTVAGLTQDVPADQQETIHHYLVKSLGTLGEVLAQFYTLADGHDIEALTRCQQQMDLLHAWEYLPRVEMMASRLGIPLDSKMQNLSGGMKRRVLLAAALIAEPNLLLLDEPTNHLDLTAIEWLEAYLKNYRGTIVVVTHDREFLAQIATKIVEIDRGKLYSYACNYEEFLDRREARRLAEERHNDLFDKRLADEEVWIRTGVKARRTRNEGRVRALKVMREQYQARRDKLGQVKSMTIDSAQSGAIVIEAQQLNYQIADRQLIKDFSLLLMRGDKLGIVGPNGCGKTTLVKLLLGELEANSGCIKRGSGLSIAYFDQLRSQLNEQETVMANVADGAEHVTIEGKSKHVASYLKDFLFSPERFNQPVSSLSGGEKNRLLLAKLLAKPVNFLVMDEPTNDLDIETLELLETMLINYTGTLILISHDRAFINQVVTSVLVFEDEGRFAEYVGGYQDYLTQKKMVEKVSTSKTVKEKSEPRKLSFNEQRELNQLPKQIETLETKIAEMQLKMAEPDFYQQDPEMIADLSQQLQANEQLLSGLYLRWEELEKDS